MRVVSRSALWMFVLVLLAAGSSRADELRWNNGTSQAIGYPNSIAFGSWNSWHLYDDFTLDEETVVTEIAFQAWSPSSSGDIRPEFVLMRTMTPVGYYNYQVGVPTQRPSNAVTVRDGRTMYTLSQTYYAVEVKIPVEITLPAGGHILGLAIPSGGLLAGYSWQGGPDTPRQPGLTCFRQRNGNGTFRDYCKSGHLAFTIRGRSLNTAPVANAGPDQEVRAASTVTLDGTGSTDDRTPVAGLAFDWRFTQVPEGSTATLSGADTATPSFVADGLGKYVVSLVVTDANGASSVADTVMVGTENLAPVASAGEDQLVIVGDAVALDGGGSSDPEQDAVTFAWSLDVPAGSSAALSSIDTPSTSFTADAVGFYRASLAVSDFIGPGAPDVVEVEAVTATEYATRRTVAARVEVEKLSRAQVMSPGHRVAMLAFADQALAALAAGETAAAADRLDRLRERCDSCFQRSVLRGGNGNGNGGDQDWVRDCGAQAVIYPLLSDARAALE